MAGKKVYGYQHQRARAAALRMLRDGTPCELCGEPMFRDQRLDYDHETPLALGGKPDGRKRLVHSSCNRRAGSRLGNAIKAQRRLAVGCPADCSCRCHLQSENPQIY